MVIIIHLEEVHNDYPRNRNKRGHFYQDLIERNLSNIQGIRLGQPIAPEMINSSAEVHQYNLNNRLLLKYEPFIREKLGENFDYTSYKSNFMDIGQVNSDDFAATVGYQRRW